MSAVERYWRGGARIGSFNATWPFAKLVVTENLLELKVVLIGTYQFKPSQVIKVESYGIIPFFAKGIRIHHALPELPGKIIFWYWCRNSQHLVEEIRSSGYGT